MQKTVFLLAWLARVGHGGQLESSTLRLQSNSHKRPSWKATATSASDESRVLGALLLALNPVSAFNTGMQARRIGPRALVDDGLGCFGRNAPGLIMGDAFYRPLASRRQLLAGLATMAPTFAYAATGATSSAARSDEKLDINSKAAKTPEAAKSQIVAGYSALGTLLDEFDAVTQKEGGDGIRRVLGTVGTSSPVYVIEPAFRLLFEKDDSLPGEYIEGLENMMLDLKSADSMAYSANFISFSSAKGKPEDYFKKSKTAIVSMRKTWLELMTMLNLKP